MVLLVRYARVMGYFINTRKRSDGTQSWGLVFRSEAEGERTTKRIKKTDLRQYGLLPSMSLDEARKRVHQLNLETKHYREAEKAKVASLTSANVTREMAARLFPEHLVREFEARLKDKYHFGGSAPEEKHKKALSRWRFVIKMLGKIDKPPKDWAKEPRVFYEYFKRERITAGYAVKCLSIMNMWGFFVSEKQGTPFLPVPSPRGYERNVIEDAADEKEGVATESLPLTPELLESAKAGLKEHHYNWLYISVWFGLRPEEIGGQWKVGNRLTAKGERVRVLEVYQTKLAGIKKDRRWKFIPILYPEQEKALELLKSGQIKEPYTKLLRAALGRGYHLYGGRKNFTNLMRAKGHQITTISKWLGHQSVDQTIRAYEARDKVEID